MSLAEEAPPQNDGEDRVFWPTWGQQDGEGALARFVSSTALLYSGFEGASAGGARPEAAPSVASDQAAARAVYEKLAVHRVNYALEPFLRPNSARQQIRHPLWVHDQRVGTCLDVATTFASMCLDAHLVPMLALGDRHACIVLRLGAHHPRNPWGRDVAGEHAPAGTESVRPGVWRVRLVDELLAADDLLPLDCVQATLSKEREHPEPFDTAVEAGRQRISRRTKLVDVAWLHAHGGVEPHPAPRHPRPGISLFVFGGQDAGETYARTVPTFEGRGVGVLQGAQGTGKSTVARDLAMHAENGAAWFLDASNKLSLIDALAQAELAELNKAGDALPDQTREGYAYRGLARLRKATDPWLVVLDNADGDPSALRGLIPEPDAAGQRVVVTTTNAKWGLAREVTNVPLVLEPLQREEVAERIGDELADLVLGRPLLLEAFARLIAERPEMDRSAVLDSVAERSCSNAGTGPLAFWRALVGLPLAPSERLLCAIGAQLPPDRLPVEMLETVAGAEPGTVGRLTAHGLLQWDSEGDDARLHRLFGAAIRADADADLLDEAAVRIAEHDGTRGVLDRFADRGVVADLTDRLERLDDRTDTPAERLGRALHGLAWVVELKGDTVGSGTLYERAERHLTSGSPDVMALRADCLHGRARTVNQRDAENRPLVEAAIEWVREAQALLAEAERSAGVGRLQALEGLLLQKTVSKADPPDRQDQVLKRATDILRASEDLRTDLLADDDPERARARFNLGGVNVRRAQVPGAAAAPLLEGAQQAYDEARAFREQVYGHIDHPHIAACWNGLAIVAYLRATLVATDDLSRTEWLREATEHGEKALRQRQVLSGPEDLNDVEKSAKLLVKILSARWSLPRRSSPSLGPLHGEVTRELSDAGILLPQVRRFTSESDPREHVADWARSFALKLVVERLGGSWPAIDTPAADGFALVLASVPAWALPAPTGYDDKLVTQAVHALGFAEGYIKPRPVVYDHVVVLAESVRAALSGPMAVAAMLAKRDLRAREVLSWVPAAGKPIAPADNRLLERLELVGLDDRARVAAEALRRSLGEDGPLPAAVVTAYEESTVPSPEVFETGTSVLLVTEQHLRPSVVADAVRAYGGDRSVDVHAVTSGAQDHRLVRRATTADRLRDLEQAVDAYRGLALELGV